MAAEDHVEDPGPPSGRAPKRKLQTSVLDNFTKLTNPTEKVRVKAGVDLLRHLSTTQDSEKTGDELKSAVRRLVRGVGSSKIEARTGFFAALVALLNLKNVTVDEIFEAVGKELTKGAANSKSENADISSGQILVAGAVLRSNLYESCSDDDKKRVLELLINAGKVRTYLTLAAYSFIVDLYEKVTLEEFTRVIFPVIKPEIAKPWPDQNLDSLYLLQETSTKLPGSINPKFLKNILGTAEIFCEETLPQLCNTLTSVSRVTAVKHPVFDSFVKIVANSDLVVAFVKTLDNQLVKNNRNKFLVATRLLQGIFENLPDPSLLPQLLTRNYLQQTVTTFKTAVGKFRDPEFEKSVQKLFDSLLTALKSSKVKSKTAVKVLKTLLFYPGIFIFEKVTKSKLIQSITATLSKDGVKKLGEVYKGVVTAETERVVAEGKIESWWNSDRVYAAHLLVKLLNHSVMQDENEWKVDQLKFLMKLGLLKDQTGNVGQELADALKGTFYSSLDLKLSKLEDLRAILSEVFLDLDATITESNLETVLRHPITAEEYSVWRQTVEMASKIQHKKSKRVFHTLFLHLGLQLFNTNPKLASDSLKELFSCYERVKNSKVEETSEDPLWIEVVVDLFLNLLSHSSHLLRNVINCVFPHLCKHMNATAIHQILAVLDPKNESNPLSHRDESSDDSGSDPESGEESEESEESDDEDIDDTSNDKLRMALHRALGAENSDVESVDLNDLDEADGEKLDEALAEAFKQFKPNSGKKSKKQNKDDETLTHFRVRVLDLVEIYLNSNPSMHLTLEIMLPLLQTFEFSIRDDHQRPLQNRVQSCLKKLASLKKFDDFEGVTETVLVELLRSLLDKGTKNAILIQDMGDKIAECCIFVINCSQIIKSGETPKKKKIKKNPTALVMLDCLENFFEKRESLIPYVLFKNVLQLNWTGILVLLPKLFDLVWSESSRPFRRNQAVELLKIFFQNHRFINGHVAEMAIVEEDVAKFLQTSLDFFLNSSENLKAKRVRERFLASLFGLLRTIKASPNPLEWGGWPEMAEAIRETRSHLTVGQDTKSAFNKLCGVLNVSNKVEMKAVTVKLNNLTGDDEEDGDGKEKTKKKHKNNKDTLRMKKASKELRLASLSEGFERAKRKRTAENGESSKKIKT